MRRPTGFDSPESSEQVIRYGRNPAAAFQTGVIDTMLRRGLDGGTGHIPIGDPQQSKSTRVLPPQQQFVGMQQLTNLVNATTNLGTAMPATKPNPGVIPLTQMQGLLAAMSAGPR